MQKDNYWIRRLNSSRLSRRRFVGGTAAIGAGAAGLALVGCGDDDDEGDDDPADPTATSDGSGTDPTATTAPTEDPNADKFGGFYRASSANNTYDTFDADRSRFTPFAATLGWTNLGIVHYRSFANAEIEGGFSEDWEQPDANSITFRLRPDVQWHDKPPVNGRAGTVEDMAYHIERNKAGTIADGSEDPNFYRQSSYLTVDTVDTPDDSTLTVTFSQPNPFFLGTLAGAYAKVQAREAVEAFEATYADLGADKIIGTGAFVLTEFDTEGTATLERNENFFRDVYMDGLQFFPLFTDNAALQAAFEQRDIDIFGPRTTAVLDELLSEYEGQIYNTRQFSANPMGGTYYGGAAPWNNDNLIGAIFRATDRQLMIQQLFQGSGALGKNVPFTQAAFGINETELITLPGYLENHEEDMTEARAMWDAADGASLGEIIIDIPDIWEGAYSGITETMVDMLTGVLGNTFTPEVHPYATITNKLINQSYGNGSNNIWFGWLSDVQGLEPSLSMYTNYNSEGQGFFQFGVQDDEIDSVTNQLVTELDVEVRQELAKDAERAILRRYGAGIPQTVLQIGNTLRWNYLKQGEAAPFVDTHNDYNDVWIDKNDPTFAGRPA